MNLLLIPFTAIALLTLDGDAEPDEQLERQSILIVVGAEGTAEYGAGFRQWADLWAQAGAKASARIARIGLETRSGAEESDVRDRDGLRDALAAEARETAEALWIVLIGHGTFDGREAKFNLRGPDLTAKELAAWLQPIARPIAVINCASSSGPFINRLSAPNRVIVTATKSGHEQNYTRFGGHLAAAISDGAIDLDKDGQTSLLEAFLQASARTAEFYRQEARLATEHALVDDNGDGRGTPAEWFHGVRVTREAKDAASPDGLRANQFHMIRSDRDRGIPAEIRARRDELESAIERLRQRKGDFQEEAFYYDLLEPLMIELARLYEEG